MAYQHLANAAAFARRQGQKIRLEARRLEQANRLLGDQRCLFGRLGDHGITGGQRRRDLAGEDGERKIPGADTDEDATAMQR